jgi:hypothetical protein
LAPQSNNIATSALPIMMIQAKEIYSPAAANADFHQPCGNKTFLSGFIIIEISHRLPNFTTHTPEQQGGWIRQGWIARGQN